MVGGGPGTIRDKERQGSGGWHGIRELAIALYLLGTSGETKAAVSEDIDETAAIALV